MKIAIPTRSFNNHGGISRCIYALSKIYSRKHEVHIFSSNFEPADFITSHLVPSAKSPPFLAEYTFASNVQSALDNFDADITYAPSSACWRADVFTANSCHKAAIEIFRKQRGISYSLLKAFEPKSRVVLEIERYNYQKGHYKKITALSERVKGELMQYYKVPPEDIRVVPPGVDTDVFFPDGKKKKELCEKYSILQSTPLFLFCGHEFKRKGLAQAIGALGKLDKALDWRLIVIGGDNRAPYISLAQKLGIEQKIIFAGFVKDISAYFNACDAFIFPTAYEPYGMVITEALSSGMPVITPRIAGAAELMTHEKDGFLLESAFDEVEIAKYASLLLSDKKLRQKMGAAARKTAQKYTWEKIAKKMMGVFEEAIDLKK
ncbi:hypothetical protein COV61_02170 [Candidatus Micrarchaeota archaeon CG11_big_fil_rev_8_21_14_0_20_47_5]|nr:MAG: hypothetical protein AUJ17_04930 [Candidatus Micrarchaeota archaeon CG1_02_47_40]PIN83766.1 MAG: hypothetical protein COV61_02170 [Candidatus Micrarchaeota archaeon CG11_big_fil_rev_8_21_14_0_20_47_5]